MWGKERMKRLHESRLARYIITGGMTTVVNYAIYFLLQAARINYITANCAAWICAVTFSFFANRSVVFRSKGRRSHEFVRFFYLRLASMAAETLLLYMMVDVAGLDSAVSKIIVGFVTAALNYMACKYSIFKERGASHE